MELLHTSAGVGKGTDNGVYAYGLSREGRKCHSQVCPDIPSSRLDERSSARTRRVDDDLITNVVGKDVVVLGESVNCLDVLIEEVR